MEEWGPDCAGGGEIGCLSILECVVELTARLAEDGQAVAPLFDWLGGWVVGWLAKIMEGSKTTPPCHPCLWIDWFVGGWCVDG